MSRRFPYFCVVTVQCVYNISAWSAPVWASFCSARVQPGDLHRQRTFGRHLLEYCAVICFNKSCWNQSVKSLNGWFRFGVVEELNIAGSKTSLYSSDGLGRTQTVHFLFTPFIWEKNSYFYIGNQHKLRRGASLFSVVHSQAWLVDKKNILLFFKVFQKMFSCMLVYAGKWIQIPTQINEHLLEQ